VLRSPTPLFHFPPCMSTVTLYIYIYVTRPVTGFKSKWWMASRAHLQITAACDPPRRRRDSDQPCLRVAAATLTSHASASMLLQSVAPQCRRYSDLTCLCVDVATIRRGDAQPFHTRRGFDPPLPTCRTSTSTPL
jgi:hypothetical protein